MHTDIYLALCAALLYFLATMLIVPGLRAPNSISTKGVFVCAFGALCFHGYLLYTLVFAHGGQNLSILNVASLISFITAFSVTMLMFKMRIWILLPVIYIFCAISVAMATLLPSAFITHLESHLEILSHITLALFSYSTLMIATLYTMQLAWIDHQLKSKKSLMINPNIPPLMVIERHLFTIILIGEILLTLTLLTGAFFVNDILAEGKAHKVILSALAWAVYAVLLWGHYQLGWRGKKVIWFSIVGAFLLTLGYFGSRFVKEIIIAA